MKFLHKLAATILGRNLESTPKEVIIDQLNEPRRLPLGRQEFEEWSDRIIAGAMIPGGEEDKQAFIDGQKCTLAGLIMHLGPTESHKPDAFFIHSLIKGAANQVAHTIGQEIRLAAKERLAKKEAEAQLLTQLKSDHEEMEKQIVSILEKSNEKSVPISPAL